MAKLIYIYNGASSVGVNNLKHWIAKHVSEAEVREITADEIKEGKLLKEPLSAALVIGGGESVKYTYSLGKDGRDAIRQYVENGGIYYGICAGAYYAATETDYRETVNVVEDGKRKHRKIRIHLKEEQGQLCLFAGKAIGKIHDFNRDGKLHYLARIKHQGIKSKILYYKGPYFTEVDGLKGDVILAEFKGRTKHPAAVSFKYGAGRGVLCAVHPEWDADVLKEQGRLHGASQEDIDRFSKHILSDLIERVVVPFQRDLAPPPAPGL